MGSVSLAAAFGASGVSEASGASEASRAEETREKRIIQLNVPHSPFPIPLLSSEFRIPNSEFSPPHSPSLF